MNMRWATRTLSARLPILGLIVVGALLAGVLLGVNLPFGSKPLTLVRGTAYVDPSGRTGTFQASRGGVTAVIPAGVAWVDRSGKSVIGAPPSCLRPRKGEDLVDASVEAGYSWLRAADGTSFPVVGWIRCL